MPITVRDPNQLEEEFIRLSIAQPTDSHSVENFKQSDIYKFLNHNRKSISSGELDINIYYHFPGSGIMETALHRAAMNCHMMLFIQLIVLM